MEGAKPRGRGQLQGNDYDWLLEAARGAALRGEPGPPVSIVIPVYDRRTMLARTLAALTHQTWPRERLQIVVADDGSRDGVEEVVARYREIFDLVHVRQPDRGFRLAAVRNLAIRAAKHDAIVQLDCDLMPEPGLVEAYARLLAVSDRVAAFGLRRFVDANALAEDAILDDPACYLSLPDVPGRVDWRLARYAMTDDLRRTGVPHSAFVGGNAAFPRAAIDEVGGYDERFQAWGREDTELGYRLFNAGFYFAPVSGAVALHQEPADGSEADRTRQLGLTRSDPLFVERCPLSSNRTDRGRSYEVPLLTVLAPSGGDPVADGRTRDALDRQTLRDLRVARFEGPADDTALRESDSPFFARVPAGASLGPGVLEGLVDEIATEPHGVLAYGGDPAGLGTVWDAGTPAEVERLLDRHVLLFRKRDWSRARWLGGAGPTLARLPRVAGLRLSRPAS